MEIFVRVQPMRPLKNEQTLIGNTNMAELFDVFKFQIVPEFSLEYFEHETKNKKQSKTTSFLEMMAYTIYRRMRRANKNEQYQIQLC